jgi:PAS domain S-box-containing protein
MSLEARAISAAQFEAIVDIAADAIISVDSSHKVALFNKGAEEIFGFSADEVLGESLDMLIPERFRAQHDDHIKDFAVSPVPARRMGERREIYGLRKDGTEFPAEASISKIHVSGQWMFTVVLRDVSDRKQTEREKTALLEAEREARLVAEHASRLRDEVLGVVSHDLRNPLSAISMCARALEEELGSADRRALELAATIKEAANWMQRMIRDLLDVASIEGGRLSIESKPSDVVITVIKAVEVFEELARERSIELVCDVPDRLPIVHADGDRLLQVLSNLLGNAIKFTHANGTVTVRAVENGNDIVVSVVDTGAGIPVEELPLVFDRFWQAKRSSGVRGSGLGLAIAKGIVAAHKGRIWVESEVGRGSAFHFTLPAINGGPG